MKIEGQIRQKLKQVLFRHRKQFLRGHLRQRPESCTHNAVVHLPVQVSGRASVRICQFTGAGGEWNNRVCDVMLGGEQQALRCPHYSCHHTPETARAAFDEKLGLGETPLEIWHIAKEYPDIAALMWVLDTSTDEVPAVFALFDETPGEDDA